MGAGASPEVKEPTRRSLSWRLRAHGAAPGRRGGLDGNGLAVRLRARHPDESAGRARLARVEWRSPRVAPPDASARTAKPRRSRAHPRVDGIVSGSVVRWDRSPGSHDRTSSGSRDGHPIAPGSLRSAGLGEATLSVGRFGNGGLRDTTHPRIEPSHKTAISATAAPFRGKRDLSNAGFGRGAIVGLGRSAVGL
jgi:hypothetical protein